MAGAELRTTHVTYDKAGKLDITAGKVATRKVPGSTRLGVSTRRLGVPPGGSPPGGPVRPGRACPLACQAALPLTDNSLWQAPFSSSYVCAAGQRSISCGSRPGISRARCPAAA
jgi:hypothetical protein